MTPRLDRGLVAAVVGLLVAMAIAWWASAQAHPTHVPPTGTYRVLLLSDHPSFNGADRWVFEGGQHRWFWDVTATKHIRYEHWQDGRLVAHMTSDGAWVFPITGPGSHGPKDPDPEEGP